MSQSTELPVILWNDGLPPGLYDEAYEIWWDSLVDLACENQDGLGDLWPEDGGEPDPPPGEPGEFNLNHCLPALWALCSPHGDDVFLTIVSRIEREWIRLSN